MKSLTNLVTIFRRETAAYFNSAIAYIFIIVFVILNGGLFMTQFFLIGRADMRPFFGTLPFLLAVFLPAVTMRLWAEEKRGNTLELLLTFPMATHELVLGKFVSSLVFYLVSLVGTITIPMMIDILGNPDTGTICGGYTGAALLGAFFLAVGIFISGLCRDQIVAFILAMIICFGLYLLGTEYLASSIDGWIPGLGSLLRHYVGAAGHFDSFAKGVVDNRDVFYFAIGTVLFLVLNGFWLEGRMRPGAKKIFSTATAICAGIFLMSNWLFGGITLGRFDLTNGQIYTISPATKKILRQLKAPVTAKFYVSPMDKMPTGMKALEQDVIDKLDELRIAGKGNFQYKIFHMEAANVVGETAQEGEESLERELERKGIQPFQVRAIVSDEVVVRLVYSSISLSYKEKPEELIPKILPDNIHELEYTLASKIYRMTLPEIPKVALFAPYEEKVVPAEIQALVSQLGAQVPDAYREDPYELLELGLEYEGFPVTRINLNEEEPIPDGAKTLIVIEPNEINDRQRYEINKFLYQGGSVFLAVQNYEYNYSTGGRQFTIVSEEKRPGINPLIEKWGLAVASEILVDEQHDVINLSGAARIGPFAVSVPVKLPFHIRISQTGMNPNISITSRLSPLIYLWGTAINLNEEKIKAQELQVDKLLESSPESWLVPFKSGYLSPSDLEPKLVHKRGPFPLAVMVRGQFANAFEGQNVPPWPKLEEPSEMETPEIETEEAEEPLPLETLSPNPGTIILIGEAKMFQKEIVQSGGHFAFFLNSVSAITLGEDLVTIRSKQAIDRSIGRTSAAAKVSWRLFVTLLVPVCITIAGASRVLLRKRAKRNYLKALLISTSE